MEAGLPQFCTSFPQVRLCLPQGNVGRPKVAASLLQNCAGSPSFG
jgi:hypothetical protein